MRHHAVWLAAAVVLATPGHAQDPWTGQNLQHFPKDVSREVLALSTLEEQLDPSRFVRIHRPVIVQLDRVAEMRPATHGDYDLWLRDGTRLTLSRTWRRHAQRAPGGRAGFRD